MEQVLITGANRGIGLELVRCYLAAGAKVHAVCRRSSSALQELANDERLQIHTLDLLDDLALSELANHVTGPLDILLNNAGTMGRASFAQHGLEAGRFGDFDRQDWHRIFDINVCTPMSLTQAFADHLERSERGRVVMVSSMLGSMTQNTVGGFYGYRASKAGLNALVASLGVDLSPRGIMAVAVHPGFVRTDMSGPMAEIEAAESAAGIAAFIDSLTVEQSGGFFDWMGRRMPW